jgi:tetratricopeptide (TPR) repeat protein
MKKTTALFTFALLLVAALCISLGPSAGGGTALSAGPAPAWAASPPIPQAPQASQPKAPQWKSREEYDAFQAMAGEKDPTKKVSLAEAFLQKFTTTDFKDLAYLEEMKAYQQLGDGAKAIEAGQKAIDANPGNLDAYTLEAYLFPFVFKGDDPDAAAKLARAETDAKRGLDVLQKAQKPANLSDEQFNTSNKARRAVFNGLIGFVALQRKDYPAAVTSLKPAVEDNPTDPYLFYRLGVAYISSEPRDYDNGIWNLARSSALAKASNNPAQADIDKYLKQVYINYHGNDEGLADIVAQAASSPTPPQGFKVAQMEAPKPTGNASVDAFNQTFFQLKLGGERAQKLWDSLKGQPFGVGGFVESVDKGTDPGTYVVKIDVLSQSKTAEGVYDIELKDSSQPNVKNLSKGDAVHFQGTIAAYAATPNLVITLDNGKINEDEIPDQPKVTAKPKPKPKPKPRTTRRTTG